MCDNTVRDLLRESLMHMQPVKPPTYFLYTFIIVRTHQRLGHVVKNMTRKNRFIHNILTFFRTYTCIQFYFINLHLEILHHLFS